MDKSPLVPTWFLGLLVFLVAGFSVWKVLPTFLSATGLAEMVPRARRPMNCKRLAWLSKVFQSEFHVPHLPSRIKLSETCHYPQRNEVGTLDHDSVQFLRQDVAADGLLPGRQIDWDGDGQVKGDWILQGDQCLAFFLGGIPGTADGQPQCLGFSLRSLRPDPADSDLP